MRKRSNEIVWQVLASVAVLCLVVLTAAVAKREFFEPPPAPVGVSAATMPDPTPPVPVRDWERVASGGHRMGHVNAPVTIVEFADFQCPACRRFATEIFPMLQAQFGDQMALVFRHWPLPNHPYSYDAARAAECAAAQGRLEAFHDLVFSQRDSLEVEPFRRFARTPACPISTHSKSARGNGDRCPRSNRT